MGFDIVPFTDEHLAGAGALLAARHRAQRAQEAALPARFEEIGGACGAVEATWRRPGTSGVAALRDGRLVGYLLGTPVLEEIWGRSAWTRFAAHALAPGEDAELYRDLYAALSPQWVAIGIFDHYALIPASDRAALDAWFALGFGHQQAYGLCEVDVVGEEPWPAGIEICRATPDDFEAIMAVADTIARHIALAPTFGITLPEAAAGWREGWAELLAEPAVMIWLARRDGKIVGYQGMRPEEPADDDLLTPAGCFELAVGATLPEERGSGISRALTAHNFAAARAAGYTHCLTDWRVTNLLASRHWPRRGFRPVAYRLARKIDPRIAWARP